MLSHWGHVAPMAMCVVETIYPTSAENNLQAQ